MKTYALALVAAAIAAPGVAQAQATAPLQPVFLPGRFRQQAMIGDTFEIRSSELALQRAQSPAVRRFAGRMVADHSRVGMALMQIPGWPAVATLGAVPAPGGGMLDLRRAGMLQQLEGARGRQFDATYARMQVMAHEEAVALYAAYGQRGLNPGLRAFAIRTLPVLQTHLADARRLPGSAASQQRRSAPVRARF